MCGKEEGERKKKEEQLMQTFERDWENSKVLE